MSERQAVIDELSEGFSEFVIAPMRIAIALERIADTLAKALDGGVLYTKDADRV